MRIYTSLSSLFGLGLLLSLSLLTSCGPSEPGDLPYLGRHQIDPQTGDTTYHRIPEFSFIDQDSQLVTRETFAGKVYVADFFFTSCPTICPKVKQQMLRIYEKYADDDRVLLLSHTIDPKRDTVAKLRRYATNLGVPDASKWHFVTGDKGDIYDITDDYMSIAIENSDAPGGFDHSGYILLIDGEGHLRGYASGLVEEEVTELMDKIDRLLAEA
jgi:protein SCO1/2